MQIAAGFFHTLGLRSDGQVTCVGRNDNGQCDLPAPPAGVSYVQIAAGGYHTLGLRSDGQVTGVGRNDDGQCELPAPPAGVSYVATGGTTEEVVQVSTADRGPEGLLVFCRDLGGAEIARLELEMASRVAELRLRLAGQLGVPLGSLELVGAGRALGPTDMLAALGCSVEASSDHGAAQDPGGPSDRPLKRRRAE